MLPLSREELLEFEHICDAEGLSSPERESVIRDAFGETAASAYAARRRKVIPLRGYNRRVRAGGSGSDRISGAPRAK